MARTRPVTVDTFQAAKQLANYVRELQNFQYAKQPSPYRHMGATITDAVLQAGLNYRTVVRPRVDRVRQICYAATTTGFLNLLNANGPASVLNWNPGHNKPQLVQELANCFKAHGVETEADLLIWLRCKKNRSTLLDMHGIGKKTVDYFRLLAGDPRAVAVDRRLFAFLERIGVSTRSYWTARMIYVKAARLLQVPPAKLEHSVWSFQQGADKASGSPHHNGVTA